MNLELSDEQKLLREAARGMLAREVSVGAARVPLEGGARLDLWGVACAAGWPGLMVSEARGGAGLALFDAALVMEECGRVLASAGLLGHLPATVLLDRGGAEIVAETASGTRRAAYLPVRPPDWLEPRWTVDPLSGRERGPAPQGVRSGQGVIVTGTVPWVPDAPGSDVLVTAVETEDGPVVAWMDARQAGVEITVADRYDLSRSLGHAHLSEARAEVCDAGPDALSGAWFVARTLLAAESLGAGDSALAMAVQYAKERHAFGRPIGSYQAIKHRLVEALRMLENTRSLLHYAAWAHEGDELADLAVAANAARAAGIKACGHAAEQNLAVHGGIGATAEHDAHLFYRRHQLSRRLLGGAADASVEVMTAFVATLDDRAHPIVKS